MRGALRIGRIFGIEVAVDASWLLVFVLLSYDLTSRFRGWHPTWTLGASMFLAIVATLLFFASVLAHELAHAMVARSFGMTVRQIRLFLFGGVSDLEREPPSPRAELWMAIVGPITSLLLGIAFLLLASPQLAQVAPTNLAESLASMTPATTLLVWLGPVNLTVGLFNLTPGFPLDGGRVLRAVLWRLTGDLHKATFAAAQVGRVIGWCFIAAGISMAFGATVPLFGAGRGGGLWLVLIGWFLSSTAKSTYPAMLVQEALEGVRASELMRRTGWLVPPGATVSSVARSWFMQSSDRAFPVVDDGKLVGIVSLVDLRRVPQASWDTTPVTEIMTPRDRLAVVAPMDEASSVIRRLGEIDVDQLPVVTGEKLVGMLTRGDVARWLELHVEPRGLRTARSYA